MFWFFFTKSGFTLYETLFLGILSLDSQHRKQRGKEKKRKTKDELKKELISSLGEDDVVGNREMNEREKGINKSQDAITVVRGYETIIIISL